ncbi:MAG TPA: class I SAM-dependent methyltransferase [Chloroflexota bacterium]|nr:class I SAM-dependent methyltransferase [Chloroflexota bacterium]
MTTCSASSWPTTAPGHRSTTRCSRAPGRATPNGSALAALRALGPLEHVLELACGTGAWTRELLALAGRVTALDGAPEMLAIARANVPDRRVAFAQVDLFAWEPAERYDLVFFSFWLSHVPPEALPAFLDRVGWAVRPGGRVFVFDEPAGGRLLSGPTEDGLHQTRALADGRRFRIVKAYYEPRALRRELERRGFEAVEAVVGEAFFHLTARRRPRGRARTGASSPGGRG